MRIFLLFIFPFQLILAQNKILLDDFEELSSWEIIESDGAELHISKAEGITGSAIRINYEFKFGTGYCGIQKKLKIKLPDNYKFSFFIRADSPRNNFEIKFLDENRENVRWYNNRNYEFPTDWKKFSVRKRNIQFAWGPTQDKNFSEFSFIEFTIASFTGGKGTIYLDELTFEEIKDTLPLSIKIYPEYLKPIVDGDEITSIESPTKNLSFTIAFNKLFELGGIKILWSNNSQKNLKIYESEDSLRWREIVNISEITKRVSIFQTWDLETHFLKFEITSSERIKISEMNFFDYQFSETKNNIFFDLALSNYSRFLPRYFRKEASYWTIVGVETDEKEALINTDGMIEVDKNEFSLLPFIQVNNKMMTYNDFSIRQYLEDKYLPIPIVEWKNKDFNLIIKASANGIPNKSSKLLIEYQLINRSKRKEQGKFHLAIVPFQVNPYYQFLNNPGGVAEVDSVVVNKKFISIDGKNLFYFPYRSKVLSFDYHKNDVISALAENNMRGESSTFSKNKLNSSLLSFDFDFSKKDTYSYKIIYDYYSTIPNLIDEKSFNEFFESEQIKSKNFWRSILNNTVMKGSNVVENLFDIARANLAYILINKDYFGIQPGSRSYERSWIRDGSLTSTALLRFGFNSEVKDFIRWYGKHIYDNGKVPCVVDKRGPDPVDEHDSHGEFLYLLNTYFKFTKDTLLIRESFTLVKKIVRFIDSLTQLRKKEIYKTDPLSAFYGLMPESISHEGYSAKPMHSFWDNFFTIRGLTDATQLALIIGENEQLQYFKSLRDEFQINLINAIRRTIKNHQIDFIPGCVELGDFDPTSTSIALFPCNQKKFLPQNVLLKTFERYYEFVQNRKRKNDFVNFTPYEIRNLSTFLLLNQKERANEILNFLLEYQHPKNWLHWAEVVWRDSSKPEFIGDMPHTWVGSDFINAFRNMIVYEDEIDSTLQLLAGFDCMFLNEENVFEAKNLITQLGTLDLSVTNLSDETFIIELNGDIQLNGWKISLVNPKAEMPSKVEINGKETELIIDNKIEVKEFPVKILINYR